jgi:hypothetical protein
VKGIPIFAKNPSATCGGAQKHSSTTYRCQDHRPHSLPESLRLLTGWMRKRLSGPVRAVSAPDDPPEFGHWLVALQDHSLPDSDREAVMAALYDLFDPEPT